MAVREPVKALRNFRVETRRALQRIRLLYPRLRFEVTTQHLTLFPSSSHVTSSADRERGSKDAILKLRRDSLREY